MAYNDRQNERYGSFTHPSRRRNAIHGNPQSKKANQAGTYGVGPEVRGRLVAKELEGNLFGYGVT